MNTSGATRSTRAPRACSTRRPAWPAGATLAEAARRALSPITGGLWDADELAMLAREVDRAAAERWEELRREADRLLND